MAEVYRAKTVGVEGFERIVAIKKILPSLATDDEFVSMFINEARIAAKLHHQCIVQIQELGKHSDSYYIVMEHVAGIDLRSLLEALKRQGTRIREDVACYIVTRVCEALDYVHRQRDASGQDLALIHRDVSPQNILISYDGEVKLCDFGIAKAMVSGGATRAGVIKGKFAYMAPEQVRGTTVDRRVDLFSLGIVLWEMLAAERLFLGPDDVSTMRKVVEASAPPIRSVNPNVSPELAAVVTKMLSRAPKDRYQWATEIIDAIHQISSKTGALHLHHIREFLDQTFGAKIEQERARLAQLAESSSGSRPKGKGVVTRSKPDENELIPLDVEPPRPSRAASLRGSRPVAFSEEVDLAEVVNRPASTQGRSPWSPGELEHAPTLDGSADVEDPFDESTQTGLESDVELDVTGLTDDVADHATVSAQAVSGEAFPELELPLSVNAAVPAPDNATVLLPRAPPGEMDDVRKEILEKIAEPPAGAKAKASGFGSLDDALEDLMSPKKPTRPPSRHGRPEDVVVGPAQSGRIEPLVAPTSPDKERTMLVPRPKAGLELAPEDVMTAPESPPVPLEEPLPESAYLGPPEPQTAPEISNVSTKTQDVPIARAQVSLKWWLAAAVSLVVLVASVAVLFSGKGAREPNLEIDCSPRVPIHVTWEGNEIAFGEPPILLDLPSGPHKIHLRADGFEPLEFSLNLQSGRSHSFVANLRAIQKQAVEPSVLTTSTASAAQRGTVTGTTSPP
ncbi:MAG: serine/threonine protein kinase [Deltaproteobacteria bacterium]|nr:serine/threonine protein kinase [Deltaproteobacteria bacterium]